MACSNRENIADQGQKAEKSALRKTHNLRVFDKRDEASGSKLNAIMTGGETPNEVKQASKQILS